jgi:hypothetical protein
VIAGESPACGAMAGQVQRLGLGRELTLVGYLDCEQRLAD